ANFDGRLEQVNPAWTKTLGWTEEELTSRGFAGFIHPEDHEATNAIQKELSQGRPIRDFENRYLCKDGSFRWLSWRCHPLVESSQIFGIARDVTDRRKNEERLVEQMALLDAAHEAILVKDMDERIIFWNKGAERTFGWTAEEVLGRKPPDLLFKNPDEYQKAYAELLAKGEYSGELLKLNKRGEELMIATRWTLVRDERGQPKSVLAMNSDVTEKKRLESQFLRAQRMDSIGTLAGGIAHDLNNMLAPILMSLEILKMKFPDEATEHLLDTLLNSAQRGADLVKQVLSFARGVEGERIVINPSHLLRDIQKIAFDTFPKSVVLDLDVPPTLWTVMGDPTQLHQVFLNLCVNARDAMPEGGQLNITLANIVLDETYAAMNPGSSPGSYVMIDISDTGTGIPPEVQERIFEPFFTTKEFGKGTGLGLSTTIGIIKSHKGFINLYSEVGKGSKFKVYLPASTSAQAAQEVAVAQTRLPRGDGELILVVDDEDAIRQTVKNTLERFNYRVVLAEHGAEAISLYVRHRNEVAVVITDMAMPVMDGPATIIALQSLDPKLKIIGSSGLSSNGGVAKAIGCGIQHFVPKPYTAEVMLRKLRDILTEDPAEPAA
ncbi:MAG TPA: PAS domain S-box protein, partial [Chthoniobacterales bacterium]